MDNDTDNIPDIYALRLLVMLGAQTAQKQTDEASRQLVAFATKWLKEN